MTAPLLLAALVCAWSTAAVRTTAPGAGAAALAGAPAAGAERATDTSPLVAEGLVNAPPAEVWRVFTTGEGFKQLGVAHAEIDLRVGGLIRTHYDPKGVLGDEGTIVNEIIAYEPERVFAIRIKAPPKGFPFKEAWKGTWSVVTMTDLGDGRTHVRISGLGYDASEESQKMRAFFRDGNGYTLKVLQSQYDAATPPPSGPAHPASDAPSLAPIEVETLVASPREQVYSWYTTSSGWKAFVGVDSTIDLRVGGPFELFFGKDLPAGQRGSEGCTVLSFIPNEMFSYTWNAPPTIPHCRGIHTWVVVRFEAVGPALTRVRLVHQGFAENAAKETDKALVGEWEKTRAYFARAWPNVLGALKGYAEKR